MSQEQLAELSRVLYAPVTIALYFAAAFAYLYALTTTVGRRDGRHGRRVRATGATLAAAGIVAHVAHEIVRGLAQQRLPLGNMFEVTSMMALVGVVAGVGYLQLRRRGELNGFVLLAGGLVLGFAGLMYAEPGPLMPILDTWWRTFHVSLLVVAMGVFTAGFVFNGLYLLRDTAERAAGDRVAARVGGATPVGATDTGATGDGALDDSGLADRVPDGADPLADDLPDAARYAALRAGVRPVRLALGVFLGAASVSWVFLVTADSTTAGVGRFLVVNLALAAAALLARWFVPLLPSTATLDGIAHRTIAFAFVLWTVGTIAGAMWAEQSWGRFWGWDPKETGAFLTWVAYAGYLHARATRGVKGRPAAWIGLAAFVILMATYLIANYVIVGLHSYAGL
jgi:ABC-type transport system involved in cytochrome c biogenesis permease subunit